MPLKHDWIERKTPEKKVLELAPACACDKCSSACEMGSGFLADGDLDKLSKHLNMSKDDVKKKYLEQREMYNKVMWRPKQIKDGKAYGKCTFYEKGVGCKIHQVKPLHCKIAMSCKEYGEQLNSWFYVNHVVDRTDPEAIRQWAVYLESHPTIPGGELKDLVPDNKKLQKILSYEMLR